jgi:hypothetical protein
MSRMRPVLRRRWLFRRVGDDSGGAAHDHDRSSTDVDKVRYPISHVVVR